MTREAYKPNEDQVLEKDFSAAVTCVREDVMVDSQQFAPSDRELLVQVVKDCQKSKVQGASGSWKDYLKSQTPSLSKTDPATHSWQVLHLRSLALLYCR